MNEEVDFGKSVGVLLVSLAVLAGLLFVGKKTAAPGGAEIGAAPAAGGADLGAQLYGQSQDPLAGKLPDTAAPVANPMDSVYKNPFE